jgi:hypothetical protein
MADVIFATTPDGSPFEFKPDEFEEVHLGYLARVTNECPLLLYLRGGSKLRLMDWGDGLGVPTSEEKEKSLVVVGTDNIGHLHIRIFDRDGNQVTDTDETKLLPTQAQATVLNLKRQLPGLLPPHVMTHAETAQVFREVSSIVGQTLRGGMGVYVRVDRVLRHRRRKGLIVVQVCPDKVVVRPTEYSFHQIPEAVWTAFLESYFGSRPHAVNVDATDGRLLRALYEAGATDQKHAVKTRAALDRADIGGHIRTDKIRETVDRLKNNEWIESAPRVGLWLTAKGRELAWMPTEGKLANNLA